MSTGTGPRYLLRPNVQVAPTEEGLGFWGWESSFVIKGSAALAQLWQAVLPYLQQGVERSALLAAVPDRAQRVLERLIDELRSHNMLLDSSKLQAPVIDAADAGPFLDTLRYLESLSDDPYAAFRRIRGARVAVTGQGPAVGAAARMLTGAGAGEVTVRPPAGDLSARIARGDVDVVVQIEVDPARAALHEYRAAASAANVPLVGAVVLDDRAVIGPVAPTGDGEGARPGGRGPDVLSAVAAMRRRGTPLVAGEDTSPVFATLAGNLAGFTALQILAGLPTAVTSGKALVVERSRLATSEHSVTEVADTLGEPPPVDVFRALAPPASRADVLERLEGLADDHFGLLRELGPADRLQVPLHMAVAELAHPSLSVPRAVQAGLDGADARLRALIQVLRGWLARLAGADGHLDVAGVSDRRRRRVPVAELAVAAGHSYEDWLADGLLQLAATARFPWRDMAEVAPSGLSSERAAWWASCLAVRFGVDLAIGVCEVDGLPAHVAVVDDGGDRLSVAAAPERTAAVDEALLQAVARMQAREDGVELPLARSSAPPEPVLGPRNAGPVPPPDRRDWLDRALRTLAAAGRDVLARPFTGPPATHEQGLLLGWIGVTDAH